MVNIYILFYLCLSFFLYNNETKRLFLLSLLSISNDNNNNKNYSCIYLYLNEKKNNRPHFGFYFLSIIVSFFFFCIIIFIAFLSLSLLHALTHERFRELFLYCCYCCFFLKRRSKNRASERRLTLTTKQFKNKKFLSFLQNIKISILLTINKLKMN